MDMSLDHLPLVDSKAEARDMGDGMGNGLFALTDIKMGHDVLSIQKPFVAVLDTPRLQDTCAGCFGAKQQYQVQASEVSLKLKACTRCHVVRYCDKNCQLKDWKFAHSLECPIYSDLYPKVLPNSARAILRIVFRYRTGKYNSQEVAAFLRLGTHAQEIRATNNDQWNRILLSAKAVREYSGVEINEETIVAFFAKLDLNSFNLTTPFYERIGLYLHPYAALMNHSCDYNAVVGFEGDRLTVKPVRPIEKDEQIYISYIDATNPRNLRHKDLSERYFFDCKCSKCEDKSACEDYFLPEIRDTTSVMTAEITAREMLGSASTNVDPFDAVKTLRSAINVLTQAAAWPITRQPYVAIRDELIVALLSAQQFESAFVQGIVRFLRVDPVIYHYESHPIRSLHTWALVKLGIHISQGVQPDRGGDFFLQRSEVNLGLIVWSLFAWLVDKESEACTTQTFRSTVRATYKEVCEEFISNGLNPEQMTKEADREWQKMEQVANQTLQLEGDTAGKP